MAGSRDFDKYLKERYEDQVKWYDNKAVYNRKLADKLQYSVILLAAITPVFAALNFRWPTIVSSSLIAAITGILKYGKFEDLWHNYRTICETLKKEKQYYDFRLGCYQDANKPEKLFVDRVESLISRENTIWSSITQKQEEKEHKG